MEICKQINIEIVGTGDSVQFNLGGKRYSADPTNPSVQASEPLEDVEIVKLIGFCLSEIAVNGVRALNRLQGK